MEVKTKSRVRYPPLHPVTAANLTERLEQLTTAFSAKYIRVKWSAILREERGWKPGDPKHSAAMCLAEDFLADYD